MAHCQSVMRMAHCQMMRLPDDKIACSNDVVARSNPPARARPGVLAARVNPADPEGRSRRGIPAHSIGCCR
jgi:hypothetical protein